MIGRTSLIHLKRTFSALLLLIASMPILASSAEAPAGATAESLEALPGFKIEHVLKADPKINGSWINMAKDEKGRLILGGQNGQPVTRITLKDGQVLSQENLKLPISETMGLLYAFDCLYVNGFGKNNEGKGVFGLFRCKDTKGTGNFDSIEFLREWKNGRGEHGAHAIALGPDKKLYVVCGNFTGLPDDLLPSSPHRNYADDLLLPRAEDGNGFGAGKKPPGGWIARVDPDGKNPELFASGQRNTYDIAFNADGELFGFDSDMEYDWGSPWYRPIRVFHAVSGAEQGFREGTGKWPEYFADSLPAAVNVGIGCPTGVCFGTGAKFPAKYQKAFYALDWTYGRLIAVHLQPNGASYTGTWENFVAPKSLHAAVGKTPLTLTDVVVGDDGALYFTTGGRNTQSNLYRVTYTGNEPTALADMHDKDGADARERRHSLEAFHGKVDPTAVDTVWIHLGSSDRWIRYAARLAIEQQPVEQWKARALAETHPYIALTALLALARVGKPETQAELLQALYRFPLAAMNEPQQLDKLRVLEVSLCRQGKQLSAEASKQLVDELSLLYPAHSEFLNRELCEVLLALGAPDAVSKTMALLSAAPTQEEQVGYVLRLRTIKTGWTPELRQQYFTWWTKDRAAATHPKFVTQWFEDAGRPYGDGASFPKFLTNFRNDAIATLDADEQKSLAGVLAAYTPVPQKAKKPAKVRSLVKDWQMTDLQPLLDQVGKGRNFERGKEVFESAQCLACHRFGNEGGAAGPDLTAVSSRFARRDILESILEPSKVISEQFMNTTIRTVNSRIVEGRVVEENDEKVVLQPNQLLPEKVEIKKTEIKSRAFSKVSPMPQELVNNFSKEEILDLLAYIESAGHKEHPDFAK